MKQLDVTVFTDIKWVQFILVSWFLDGNQLSSPIFSASLSLLRKRSTARFTSDTG